jgi:hypothetical protein
MKESILSEPSIQKPAELEVKPNNNANANNNANNNTTANSDKEKTLIIN